MDNNLEVDMEIAPREVVMQSARQFAKLFTGYLPLFRLLSAHYTNCMRTLRPESPRGFSEQAGCPAGA